MIALPSISAVKEQLWRTIKRFPLPSLCALLTTICGITLIHDVYTASQEDIVGKILLVSILGLALFTGLTLALESCKKLTRNLVLGAGVIGLVLYFFSLPHEFNSQSGSMWMARHVFLCLAALVTIFWAPFWRTPTDNRTLWYWSSLLIGSAVITGFFALVLFLGLAAALWSIDSLFALDINEELYFDIWVLCAALFSPLFWLSQYPEAPLQLKAPTQVPAFMSIFTKYIMSPLALGYLVILYAYTARILITWEWPKNVLGWLVIAFLGVAIFTYFLWTPLLKPSFEKYRRIFWVILIPQIFLLFVAIGWRIHAYSWTENRYFVVVLGLWLLGTTLYFIARKNAKFKWIFVALTAIIILSQVGPLSGYHIGKKAQISRLDIILTEIGVKAEDQTLTPIEFEPNLDQENEVANILDYLKDRHGEKTLKALFPDVDSDNSQYWNLSETVMEHYGLTYRSKWERDNNRDRDRHDYRNFSANMSQPLNISGYDWKVTPQTPSWNDKETWLEGFNFETRANDTPPRIEVFYETKPLETIDVSQKFSSLLDKRESSERINLNPEDVVVIHESDYFQAKIYLTSGWGRSDEDFGFSADIYLRLKEPTPTNNQD